MNQNNKNQNNKNQKVGTLAALTSAALGLPALSHLAHAEGMPTQTELGYRYADYQEDDLNQEQVVTGSTERYHVKAHQFRLLTPVAESTSLKVDAVYETMSGASAMGTVPGPQGEPQLIMTGASISEDRTDVNVELRQFSEGGNIAGSAGYSNEPDYKAWNLALETERLSEDRRRTYSGGIGYSHDEIEPVQTPGVNRPLQEERDFVSGFFSLSQVNSARWQTQIGVYGGYYDGYLADPYKTRDIRPDERQQFALSARSRYYFGTMKAAFHTDYRFYSDDWGIEAHTLDFTWYQNLSDHWQLSPGLRYYSQSQADFYVATDSGTRTGFQTSDYRMSPYGALSYSLGIQYKQPQYTLKLYAERYDSDGDYALKSVKVENPNLVSYTLVQLGLDYRF